MDFCNDANFRDQIADILATNLFGSHTKKMILGWYDVFIKHRKSMPVPPPFVSPKNIIAPTSSVSLPRVVRGCGFLGHDLPVWLSNGKSVFESINSNDCDLTSNHRVMVIGQDPLRSASCSDFIMSPWGLHYPSGFSKHSNVYNNLFTPLLQEGCEVYVTDYWKLFAANANEFPKDKAIAASRKRILTSMGPSIFDDILNAEIDAFQPQSILILSSDANIYEEVLSAISSRIWCAKCVSFNAGVINIGSTFPSPRLNVVCANHPNSVRGGGPGSVISFYRDNVIPLLLQ